MARGNPGRLVKHDDGRMGVIYLKEYQGLKPLKLMVHWVDDDFKSTGAEPTLVDVNKLNIIGYMD